jgi:site-specific recombinase XerD
MDTSECKTIRDLFPASHRQFEVSQFRKEFRQFALWLDAERYARPISRSHLSRLKITLEKMPTAKSGAKYLATQLNAAFRRTAASRSNQVQYHATGRAYQRFLSSQNRLIPSPQKDRFSSLRQQYRHHLEELRAFSTLTIRDHSGTIADFLERGVGPRRRLSGLTHAAVAQYVRLKSQELTRRSLQNVVMHLRGFLFYCHDRGEIRARLDTIDLPRVYRDELPPRALAWDTVQALLRSIDRRSEGGWRDYAILHLMAHYGLRPSEVISLRLDSIDWTANTLRISQCKTRSTLLLPIAPQTIKILRHYIDHARDQHAQQYPELFLRLPSPRVALKGQAVTLLFQKRLRQSKLNIGHHSAYSLRHSFAMRLLGRGVGIKAIGDVMGHHDLRSTCMYLRLDMHSLRDVPLPVPTQSNSSGAARA